MLQGVLLVTGLSQCKENYQASWLCELPWRCKKPYRIECGVEGLSRLALAISRNQFSLIIIAHPGPDPDLAKNNQLNVALKQAVQQQGVGVDDCSTASPGLGAACLLLLPKHCDGSTKPDR